MSSMSDDVQDSLKKTMTSFDVDMYIQNCLPFLAPELAVWQKGKREQLKTFKDLLKEFIEKDMIKIHTPRSPPYFKIDVDKIQKEDEKVPP